VGRFNRDSRKIVLDNIHSGSVSKAIWPINTRTNTHMLYYKSSYRKQQSTPSHTGCIIPSSPQQSTHKLISAQNNVGTVPGLRIAFALLIAGLVFALCIFYSWTILLILSLLCAATTLIMIHILFDEEIQVTNSDKQQRHNANESSYTVQSRSIEQTPMPPSIPVSLTASQSAENTQLAQYYLDNTSSFPATPMPVTPIIRVLETIDLSSTNVEHFLDIHNKGPHIPEAQSAGSEGETKIEQGKPSAKPHLEE
jgi:hypothetical protein